MTFKIPIVVVGNLTIGGSGKTPLVIYLARALKANGFHPGVVSRGYRGKAQHWPQIVTDNSDAKIVGDEALLIVRKTACPMVVGPDRVKAVRMLLAAHCCNVVISDDGLQHHALGRNLDIVVIDGERRFGNGLCLPAGPLREPITRLEHIAMRICNGGEAKYNEYQMLLKPAGIYSLHNPQRRFHYRDFQQQTVHAVAGIGYPQRFFTLLQKLGFSVICHAFPDHYSFKSKDFAFNDNAPIIMTEKDAMRCLHFADKRFYYLAVAAYLEQATDFLAKLYSLLTDKKLSG